MPTITINVNVSEKELSILRQNSLERVLNTMLSILEVIDDDTHEDVWITEEDIKLLKPVAAKIWYAGANEALKYSIEE